MSTAITDLPAVTVLTGSESVPVVQNGVTKRAAVNLFAAAGTGALTSADIGVTVEAYDPTILKDADIGVSVQAYDATILVGADIGVTVQAAGSYEPADPTILKDADIGVSVQAYDVDTAKLDVIQTWTANQTFNDGTVKLNGATSGTSTLKAPAIASTYTHTLPAATGTLALLSLAQTWSADQTFTETTETTYSLTGTDIDPVNGALQYKTISGTTTFTATNFAAGQAVVVALTDGSSHTVNWPTMTWVTSAGNAAPTLTAYDVIVLWKIGTTLYGAYVGSGV